jgi:hypothetical protein
VSSYAKRGLLGERGLRGVMFIRWCMCESVKVCLFVERNKDTRVHMCEDTTNKLAGKSTLVPTHVHVGFYTHA